MSFINSPRFPDDISYGSEGGPLYQTHVETIQSGFESRNQNWSRARHVYDVSYGVREMPQLRTLTAFFHQMRGRLHTFRYKDWGDYTATSEDAAGEIVDVGGTLYLAKVYGTANPYTRIITKPVQGTILVNGSDTGFTLDYTTGVITGPTAGDPWTGEFDVPVRFDQDELPTNLESLRVGSTAVRLIEVRE